MRIIKDLFIDGSLSLTAAPQVGTNYQLYYDPTTGLVTYDVSGGGGTGDVTQAYVDGSLAARDISIANLDSSLKGIYLDFWKTSGNTIFKNNVTIDASSNSFSLSYRPTGKGGTLGVNILGGGGTYTDPSLLKSYSAIAGQNTETGNYGGFISAIDTSNSTAVLVEVGFTDGVLIADSQFNAGAHYLGDYSSSGPSLYGDWWIPSYGATKSYTDSSLSSRDTSIAWLNTNKLNNTSDTLTGILTVNGSINVTDASISTLRLTGLTNSQTGYQLYYNVTTNEITYGDVSGGGATGASQTYVDGSLAERDISIAWLASYNDVQDASIATALSNQGYWTIGDTSLIYYSDGSVGIGTATPANKLTVSYDGSSLSSSLISSDVIGFSRYGGAVGIGGVVASSSAAHRAVYKGVRSGGDLLNPSVPSLNDQVLSILGSIYDGTTVQGTAAVDFYVDGAVSSGNAPQRISFVTSVTDAAGRKERLTIKRDGSIGINNASPQYTLDVSGTFYTKGVARFGSDIYAPGIQNIQTPYQLYYNPATDLITYGDVSGGTGSQGTLDASAGIYVGTFNGTGDTSLGISYSTHGLTNDLSILVVEVYDENDLNVFVDVYVNRSTGDVSIYWDPGTLGANCRYIIASGTKPDTIQDGGYGIDNSTHIFINCFNYIQYSQSIETDDTNSVWTFSNLGKNALISIKKTSANDKVITIDGSGYKFINMDNKALPDSSINVTLTGTANFNFEINLWNSGFTDAGDSVIHVTGI